MTDKTLVERLRERRKLKYMADCKCGQCQCVHIDDVYAAADEIERLQSALRSMPDREKMVEFMEAADQMTDWADSMVPGGIARSTLMSNYSAKRRAALESLRSKQ
jgi:hypothetical protein